MPTFTDPAADAAEAEQTLRGLAHATRKIDDPRGIYSVLGSLTRATSSLEQALHQLAAVHDAPAGSHVTGGDRARDPGHSGLSAQFDQPDQQASVEVSWELHRAGEILRHVVASLDHAHQAEACVVYDHPEQRRSRRSGHVAVPDPLQPVSSPEMSL